MEAILVGIRFHTHLVMREEKIRFCWSILSVESKCNTLNCTNHAWSSHTCGVDVMSFLVLTHSVWCRKIHSCNDLLESTRRKARKSQLKTNSNATSYDRLRKKETNNRHGNDKTNLDGPYRINYEYI